jgi:hypothetical protein
MASKGSDFEVKIETPSGAPSPVPEPESPTQVSPSPSTRPKYADGDMVILAIGSDKEKLHAHGHRLARTSQFFTTELKKERPEGQAHIVSLPEEDVNTVTRYLDFVYGEGLPTVHTIIYEDLDAYDDAYLQLFELYTFAERVLDTEVQHAIIKETLRLTVLQSSDGQNWLPDDRSISLVYQGTPANSPARRLLVDLHVSSGVTDNLTSDTCDLMYLADLARAFNTRVQDSEHTDEFRLRELNAWDYLV